MNKYKIEYIINIYNLNRKTQFNIHIKDLNQFIFLTLKN